MCVYGHNALMRAQESSYHYCLNALLSDALSRGEYFGGFRFHVEKESHFFHLCYSDGDK